MYTYVSTLKYIGEGSEACVFLGLLSRHLCVYIWRSIFRSTESCRQLFGYYTHSYLQINL